MLDHVTLQKVAEGLTIAASGAFAGGAVMESLVDHPARRASSVIAGHEHFQQMMQRADPYMPIMALLSCASAFACWWFTGNPLWIAIGVFILFVVPFTLFAIVPTNRILLDAKLGNSTINVPLLLQRWGRLHLVRSVIGTIAFVTAIACVLIGA